MFGIHQGLAESMSNSRKGPEAVADQKSLEEAPSGSDTEQQELLDDSDADQEVVAETSRTRNDESADSENGSDGSDDEMGEDDDPEDGGGGSEGDNMEKGDDQGDDPESFDSSSDSDSDGDDSESSDSDSDKDHDGISEYEKLRLERIRRNREYLEKLGLEKAAKIPRQKKSRPRKKVPKAPVQRRSSLSRRTKKETINYAKQIPITSKEEAKMKKAKAGKAGDASGQETSGSVESSWKKKKAQKTRMDRSIYEEFNRIKSEKKEVLRDAKKAFKHCDREVKYWQKRCRIQEKKMDRIRKREEENANMQQEMTLENGLTIRKMMQECDKRLPELQEAIQKYDDEFRKEEKDWEMERKHEQLQYRSQLISALDEYPKAMKDAMTVLNTVLMERAPKDPPPPRRSKRSGEGDVEPQSPKKKKGKKSKEESTSHPNAVSDHSMSNTALPKEEIQSSASPSAETDRKTKKKPKAKNVGGWVSPEFAARLDRQWLSQYQPLCTGNKFHLDQYIPQVGDVILYYPLGHKAFLEAYPDILGVKTRQLLRIPLWERAKKAQVDAKPHSNDAPGDDQQIDNEWWTQEWLDGMTGDASEDDDYPLACTRPILCSVQSAMAEFPPDSDNKVKKKRNKDDKSGVMLEFKSIATNGKKSKTPPKLRLAVTLRPLTSLKDEGPNSMVRPPIFSVVTFPSPSHRPFLIPFSWAYSSSHSIRAGDQVNNTQKNGPSGLAHDIRPVETTLEDHLETLAAISSHFKEGPSRNALLSECSSDDILSFLPPQDILVVLDTWDNFLLTSDQSKSTRTKPSICDKQKLWESVCATLPFWDAVQISDIMTQEKSKASPWELMPSNKRAATKAGASPVQNDFRTTLSEPLRKKLCFTLEQIMQENESIAPFIEEVSDEIAPGYSCAVPVPMSFSKILTKLSALPPKSKKPCFYRSVGAVLSDINLIRDNCLLYNDPESPLAEQAVEMAFTTKDAISKIVKLHNKEMNDIRKADEERRQLLLRFLTSAEDGGKEPSGEGAKDPVAVCRIKKPYNQQIYGEWLQTFEPTPETENSLWIPQAGDKVVYSRKVHAEFIKKHFESLENLQCVVPTLDGHPDPDLESGSVDGSSASETGLLGHQSIIDRNQSGWEIATVRWTRACFPKLISKKSHDNEETFETNSTILALGLEFQSDEVQGITTVYWRPSLFPFDGTSEDEIEQNSYLKASPDDMNDCETSNDDKASSLSQEQSRALCRCLNLLKRRCIRGADPGALDTKLTKASINAGYIPSSPALGLKSLPFFAGLLERKEASSNHGTRKKGVREHPEIDAGLLRFGFVPFWLESAESESKEKVVPFHETISPWPSLSLELITLRLENGFYRHRQAVENDLVESYCQLCFLLLGKAASRRKSPLSIKKVAKKVGSARGKADKNHDPEQISDAEKEEEEWAERIRHIRELYATAIVCVSNTNDFERLSGLETIVIKSSNRPVKRDEDPIKSLARQKLDSLIEAIAREKATKKRPFQRAKLFISCNGERVSSEVNMKKETSVAALEGDRTLSVSLVVDGKQFYTLTKAPMKESITAAMDGRDVSVTVICDHESFGVPTESDTIVKQVNHVEFEGRHFGLDPELARVFYKGIGYSNPCARCQAMRRTFFTCRIQKKHTNPDFDWLKYFSDGQTLDSILRELDPTYIPSETAISSGQLENDTGLSATALDTAQRDTMELQKETEQKVSAQGKEDDDQNEEDEDGDNKVDPVEMLQRSERLLLQSKSFLKDAEKYAASEDIMSKEFVRAVVPIDETDGHYIYCVVCGLSGDLLCCDGCSNVLHHHCAGLAALPDEDTDWFCEECQMNGKTDRPVEANGRNTQEVKGKEDAKGSSDAVLSGKKDSTSVENDEEKKIIQDDATTTLQTSSGDTSGKSSGKQPFGRCEFDLDALYAFKEEVDNLVAENHERLLQSERNERKKERNAERKNKGPQVQAGDLLDPFMKLSELTRSFLATINIESAHDLLAARTSEVGRAFGSWREKEGMLLLKRQSVSKVQ